MEDVISHEREQAFAHRTVTASDLAQWPNIIPDGAGRLIDWHVFIGPTEADAWPLKSKQLFFIDSQVQDPRAQCECYALSTDSKFLAASFGSTYILIWQLSDGLLVQHHRSNGAVVCCLSFSPDNRTLISGSSDQTAIVWDVQRGCALLRLEGHRSAVNRAAYAPNGALIATSDLDKSVKIWNALTGTCLHSFDVHELTDQLIFSSDSLCLYIQVTHSCLIYDMKIFRHTAKAILQHGGTGKICLSVSRQGDRIITGTGDGDRVKIWNAVTSRELLVIERKRSHPVAFSPDGTEVLVFHTQDDFQAAFAYDSQTGQLRRTFRLSYMPRYTTYSPNGDYVAFANQHGDLKVYGAKSGIFIGKVEGPNDDALIQAAEFLPDSQTLLLHFSKNPYGPLHLCNIQDMVRM